mgnify:CR=1 FL=1
MSRWLQQQERERGFQFVARAYLGMKGHTSRGMKGGVSLYNMKNRIRGTRHDRLMPIARACTHQIRHRSIEHKQNPE